MTKPLVEGRYEEGQNGTVASIDLRKPDTLRRLADGWYINESIIIIFSYMFNFWEQRYRQIYVDCCQTASIFVVSTICDL